MDQGHRECPHKGAEIRYTATQQGASSSRSLSRIAKVGPHGDLTFDELLDSSHIFGTPEECLAALSELRAVGIHDVICTMHFAGVLDHRQALDSMQLFATKVMPQLA